MLAKPALTWCNTEPTQQRRASEIPVESEVPEENQFAMGHGRQAMMKVEEVVACKALAPGKAQVQRQAAVREYMAKLALVLLEHLTNHGFCVVDNFLGVEAASLLLEEVAGPSPGQGECRGIRYLCNLLDSVVTMAARQAKKNGLKNVLSEITARDLGLQIGNPVPEATNQMPGLTATVFLNKEWGVDTDGGELRLSPSASTLATIPPVFDRVVFYPHHLTTPLLLPASRSSTSCTLAYKG